MFSHYKKCIAGTANKLKHTQKKMSENLKVENIAKATKLLPKPKTYPTTVTVVVGKLKYTFRKIKTEWYYKF
jgi:hypothetical protein